MARSPLLGMVPVRLELFGAALHPLALSAPKPEKPLQTEEHCWSDGQGTHRQDTAATVGFAVVGEQNLFQGLARVLHSVSGMGFKKLMSMDHG